MADKNSNKTNKKMSNESEKRLAELENELKEVATTIDKVEDEKLQVTNQLKKALADYKNLEKSIDTQIEMRMVHLKKSMASNVIEVLDDLKFAEQAKADLELKDENQAWADGVVASMRKISKALETLGIEEISAEIGDEFNANLHEAVAMIDGEKGDKPKTIKEVAQKGYRLGDFVIRPSRVIVSK